MRTSCVKNGLVVVVILLFVGVAFAPLTQGIVDGFVYNKEKFDIIADNEMIFKIFGGNNSPPYAPTPILPDPIPIDVNLSWYGGDPDPEDTVTYDVYLGEYDPFESPPFNGSVGPYPANQTRIWYDIPGVLEFNTKYCLIIVAFDNHGANNSSGPCTFTTEPNYPPDPAYNPIPPDGAYNMPPIVTLYWNGSDPNSGDKLTYDVYFGPNDPPLYKTTQEENYWETYELPLLKDFYWRIDTRDREGLQTDGYLWSFRTGPPFLSDPEINGPNRGMPGIDYDFTFVSTHPDNQNISYYVDWGDKTNSGWTSFHYAGEEITLNHSWSKEGTYIIKAKAKDIYEEESLWSEHEINIPRNRAVNFNINLLSWLLERFPLLEVFLRVINLLR